jgi:hypothetical protein
MMAAAQEFGLLITNVLKLADSKNILLPYNLYKLK